MLKKWSWHILRRISTPVIEGPGEETLAGIGIDVE
jgi:hypothetical protein